MRVLFLSAYEIVAIFEKNRPNFVLSEKTKPAYDNPQTTIN
ncbi:MAG: hypothetical protein UU43_C0001G0118 [Candidatus Falkowbacteria bacterium GW2011_GWA2_41_14]|uniref:Uncharacterized protein n=1 Tax=Candidatus Falkowbacteria bacterium GW2011_GWA2_41_14 TaxID=1618635 RepID=A0A0G0UT83_9BACT|nr:MAG: hypothetical protein UU43_C0001G0118 [Candidatus Falkowbacteria bacterium GW2011_GWA2_41_14]